MQLRTGIQPNRQKQSRHRLKLVNAPAQHGPISLEKNKMTAPGDGAHKMRSARMIQRLASANPNDRGPAGNKFAYLFVRNRMIGIVMQKFSRIHKLNGAYLRARSLREPGLGEVRCKPQRKPQHAL